MAVRTVSASGGNFTAGSTWIGGIAPTNNDSIIANSSSGNLTLTSSTVNLQSADFTGYTRTLALGNFNMIFNASPANGTITLSPSMTITRTAGINGNFRITANTTIISNGLPIPLNTTLSPTITLSGDLTVNILNSIGSGTTITGADMIITHLTPVAATPLIISPGFKMIYRPGNSNTLTLSGGRGVGYGHFQFDTSGTVSLPTTTGFYLTSFTGRNTATTVEFLQTPIWDGVGAIDGLPTFNYDTYGIPFNGLTTTLIMATNSLIRNFVCDGGFNNSVALSIQNRIQTQELFFKSSLNNLTYNIIGSGGFSASNVLIMGAKSTTNISVSNGVDVKLSADAEYDINSLTIAGFIGNTPSCSLSSLTASVPVSVNISNGGFSYANITDINNTGTSQYALSANGNQLTSTTGFIDSVPSGGAGGSFTFVN